MIKEKFVKKGARNFDVSTKFNSLKNKSDVLNKINIPVIKLWQSN